MATGQMDCHIYDCVLYYCTHRRFTANHLFPAISQTWHPAVITINRRHNKNSIYIFHPLAVNPYFLTI